MVAPMSRAARLQGLRNVAHPRLRSKPWATVGVLVDPLARYGVSVHATRPLTLFGPDSPSSYVR